jgi:GDP-4-dehydro-6-deoxy-D-mannose reductase
VRVLVTGAAGFVGRWLMNELTVAGHVAVDDRPDGERVDVQDAAAIARLVGTTEPEAIVHLAAVAYGPDARQDPDRARAVNVEGTKNLLAAVRRRSPAPIVLVTGSSEVYGIPSPDDLPLDESAPLRTAEAYGLSKLEQERVALEAAALDGLRLAVTRAFNHTGPGQRPVFAVPALIRRTIACAAGEMTDIAVGNLDVRRDFSDVRDVARAYRLVLEGLAGGAIPAGGTVFNVASGTSVPIRDIVAAIASEVGVEGTIRVDPELVRTGEAPDIRGDAGRLAAATGWSPTIGLEQTIADMVAAARGPGH